MSASRWRDDIADLNYRDHTLSGYFSLLLAANTRTKKQQQKTTTDIAVTPRGFMTKTSGTMNVPLLHKQSVNTSTFKPYIPKLIDSPFWPFPKELEGDYLDCLTVPRPSTAADDRSISLLCVELLTPSLPQPVKFPGWRVHCKQYIWWSCIKSIFNTTHFHRNPLACSCE